MNESFFFKSIQKEPYERNIEELHAIVLFLRKIDIFASFNIPELYDIAKTATQATLEANSLLYKKGDVNGPWYLILEGNVLINEVYFKKNQPFGYEVSIFRPYDCFVIEKTEVMVIESSINYKNFDPLLSSHNNYQNNYSFPLIYTDFEDQVLHYNDHLSINSLPFHSYENGSIVETSSLYSIAGSSGGIPDFAGLQESAVDSDIEFENQGFSDIFYEILKKNLDQRTNDDITCIYSSLLNFQVFRDMPQQIVMQLSSVMSYAHIYGSEEVLLSDGEILDAWTVVLEGELILINMDKTEEVLKPGCCFGIDAIQVVQMHKGILLTKSKECKLAIIPQEDYMRIYKELEEKINSHIEKGQIVMVTQTRNIFGQEQFDVIIRATPHKLFLELLKDPQSDQTFIEDFLLTYRTFYIQPILLAQKLLQFFDDFREQVILIIFEWITMHFIDFERHQAMLKFLDDVENQLKNMEMRNHLRRLHILLDSKALPRSINLSRATREQPLGFSLVKNANKCFFISDVHQGSKAHDAGIKVGDEILEVNGQSFKNFKQEKEALDFLKSKSHLLISVKSNLIGFNDGMKSQKKKNIDVNSLSKHKKPNGLSAVQNPLRAHDDSLVLGGQNCNNKINTFMNYIFPKRTPYSENTDQADITNGVSTLVKSRLTSSHPNLNTIHNLVTPALSYGEPNVIKIYRADQTFRYLKVSKVTTANEVVIMSLVEFSSNINNLKIRSSSNYSLYEISLQVNNNDLILQRRLKDTTNNLLHRASLYSRYYLKENQSSELLFPEESIVDLKNEVHFDFLTLDTLEVAYQLTCRGLDLFSKIRPLEYIIDLFKLGEDADVCANLMNFSQLSNTEMFWVVTSICMEQNLSQRVKILKKYILIAQSCIECQNFNSAFAIISGLGHQSVIRLKHTWDKLSNKYLKLFKDLESIMNPTKNMQNYRNRISKLKPPIIPFFPLANKDLTFIHLGNESVVDGLINFEKLRMIAKEIRSQYSMVLSQQGFISILDKDKDILDKLKIRIRRHVTLMSNSVPAPNMKQLFDMSLMSKKVSTYLDCRKIISNEEQLQEMSNCCESQLLKRSENSASSINILKSLPNASKFGVESPDNMRKLFALSDKSRPFKKPNIFPISGITQTSSINIPKPQSRSINGNQSLTSSRSSQKSNKDNISTKSASPQLSTLSRESSSLSSNASRPNLYPSRSLRESTQNLAQKNISFKPSTDDLSTGHTGLSKQHIKSSSADFKVLKDSIATQPYNEHLFDPHKMPVSSTIHQPPKNQNKDKRINSDNQISSV